MTFHTRDYAALEHGYATTIHKAQGTMVDISYPLLSGQMDRHSTYVALSRHQTAIAAFYAEDRFTSLGRLAERLGRDGSKEQSLAAGEGERQGGAGGGVRQRLSRVRAALERVGTMAKGRIRLEQQVERAREAAAQLRQQRPAGQDAAMPQDGGAAGTR